MCEGSVVTWADPVTDPPGMSDTWPLSSSLPLGALPGATPCARLHARAVLHEWGLAGLAEAAELIFSELVTNAVRASTAPDGRPRYDTTGMPVVVLRLASDRFKLQRLDAVFLQRVGQLPRRVACGNSGDFGLRGRAGFGRGALALLRVLRFW